MSRSRVSMLCVWDVGLNVFCYLECVSTCLWRACVCLFSTYGIVVLLYVPSWCVACLIILVSVSLTVCIISHMRVGPSVGDVGLYVVIYVR